MDRCEELAATWGVLPQVVLQMPSVHVRILWESYVKRQRRELKWQAQLAGVTLAQKAVGGALSSPDVPDWNQAHAQAASLGIPVKNR